MKRPVIISILCAIALNATGQEQALLSHENIDAVIAQMTLEEKARLLNGSISSTEFGWEFVGNTKEYVPGAAAPTVGFPQYGIPFTILADGPAGLRINPKRDGDNQTYYCTAFPVGTLLASSWNIDNVHEVAAAMGREVREYGCDVLLAPAMNIQRNPLCGRNFEYFSEDPLLAGEIGAAYVGGLQSEGVGATVKHFIANNQETNRENNNAVISQRALREIYLRPFEITIKKSDPWAVMTSYNKVNGKYCAEDHELLQGILREEWGWNGLVMTDWIGRRNTAAQVHAGNDLLTPGSEVQVKDIIEGVKNGTISVDDVDRNVKRILEYVMKTPHFKGYDHSDKPDLKANAAIARKSAAEGMILLKNNGILPLKETRVALYGNGCYDITCGGTGSGNVNRAYTSQLYDGLEKKGLEVNLRLKETYLAYLDYAMKKLYNERTMVMLDFGREHPFDEMPVSRETMLLREPESDVAILAITRNAGEGRDRQIDEDYYLTEGEIATIKDLSYVYHQTGKKLIVILNIGGVIETASWKDYADAIICAWQPGQEGGNALADLITGEVSPSGKLPMTFPVNYFDHASSYNFPCGEIAVPQPHYGFWAPNRPRTSGKDIDETIYAEGIYVGYRHFDKAGIEPVFPFGFGLSYTSFEYGKPKISKKGDEYHLTMEVRNTGRYAGKEVVQLYVTAPEQELDMPEKELRAFAKTKELKPGESEILTLVVNKTDLASFNESGNSWTVAAGTYTFKVGASSRDIRHQTSIKL
ncbi:MAG: glycoside hydrolase family 3 C-terminal domain-containing protein [Bacteroidales bacterium]|nr:glycoside hydrolase family 3 C-terminal domain-containing protein [Bacteroidales bacterium]